MLGRGAVRILNDSHGSTGTQQSGSHAYLFTVYKRPPLRKCMCAHTNKKPLNQFVVRYFRWLVGYLLNFQMQRVSGKFQKWQVANWLLVHDYC